MVLDKKFVEEEQEMMTLPYNLTYLYDKKWLGVQLVAGSQPITVNDEETQCVVQPDVVYPVIYFSLKYGRGIFQVDDGNSFVFSIDSNQLKFVDIHSEVLN